MGRIGRRVAALCIDWAIAMILAALIFKSAPFADLAIFAVTQMIFVGVTGHSIGHRTMRLQVQGMDGKAITPLKGIVRTLLILLVIPVLISDADQRGYHDKIGDSILVRI